MARKKTNPTKYTSKVQLQETIDELAEENDYLRGQLDKVSAVLDDTFDEETDEDEGLFTDDDDEELGEMDELDEGDDEEEETGLAADIADELVRGEDEDD